MDISSKEFYQFVDYTGHYVLATYQELTMFPTDKSFSFCVVPILCYPKACDLEV